MVDKDELTWMRMNAEEAQQAALVRAMEDTRQYEEYKEKCVTEIAWLKELRKQFPNNQEFGEEVSKRLKQL